MLIARWSRVSARFSGGCRRLFALEQFEVDYDRNQFVKHEQLRAKWLLRQPRSVATGSSLNRRKGPTTRVAGLVPLASGQSFKFHFAFNEDGYLYIFGPGENNQPTAFLTTKPLPKAASRATGNARD